MQVAEEVRQRIASGLAAALPTWADREAVAKLAGIRDVQLTGSGIEAWRLLLDQAIEQERLASLMRVASARQPDDRNLAHMAEVIEAGGMPRRPVPWAAVVAVFVFTVAAISVLVLPTPEKDGVEASPNLTRERSNEAGALSPATRPSGAMAAPAGAVPLEAGATRAEGDAPSDVAGQAPSGAAADEEAADAEAAVGDEAARLDDAAVADAAATNDASTGDEVAAGQEAAPEATPRPVAAEATAAPARVPASSGDGPCAGREGYAYMGASTTLAVGDVWAVDRPLNVREEYPGRDNGWNPRATVVCVLPSGVDVELYEAPIQVDGGAVWVRVSGDKVRVR